MDTVNDGPVRYGIPNINDTQTITEMVASGCHLIMFTTGAGSVVGQAVAPVSKACPTRASTSASPKISTSMAAPSPTAPRRSTRVAERIVEKVVAMASGEPSKSEALGHQEFALNYKTYEPIGPACLPLR